MIFLDASAIIAVLAEEPEFDILLDLLQQDPSRATSPLAVFEAVVGLSRKTRVAVEEAERTVRDFLAAADVKIVPITDKDADTALAAFSRYGKGRGHPAQLNLGDCFAYASAQNLRSSLLFKGGDFSRTDVRVARRPG